MYQFFFTFRIAKNRLILERAKIQNSYLHSLELFYSRRTARGIYHMEDMVEQLDNWTGLIETVEEIKIQCLYYKAVWKIVLAENRGWIA